MRVLFGICSWGLGHAVRDLPLIKKMLQAGHSVTVAGKGRSLQLVKDELKNKCSYYEIPDYSPVYSEKNFSVVKFVARLPAYLNEIAKEHERIKQLVNSNGYDRIISDSRFGVCHPEIPSFFIFHQLRFIPPVRIKVFERATEGFNYLFRKRFCKFLVPDWEENGLSGDLSHNLHYFKKGMIEYLGPLCDLKKRDLPEDIDYFISISGPEPQRTILERKIMDQIFALKGKVVVTLGKPEERIEKTYRNIKVFSYLNRERQEEMMNRSRLMITRPGYTTIMELAVLGKKALLIPTPGQTEQVYLASYHGKKGNFYSVSQEKLNLARDVEEAKRYPGIRVRFIPGKAEQKFMEIVFGK